MIELTINGKRRKVDAPGDTPLLWVLRDHLDMNGTKFGCGRALCGACTVLADGNAIRSCVTTVGVAADMKITTIEGAGTTATGRAVQAAWRAIDVPQCGYCQPGQIMSAIGLLSQAPQPSDEQIDGAMSGNLCRCGTYNRIRAAIHRAADNGTKE